MALQSPEGCLPEKTVIHVCLLDIQSEVVCRTADDSDMNTTGHVEALIPKPKLHDAKCEMANCKSRFDPKSKKSFFRFPLDNYYCSQWVFVCARVDLVDQYLEMGSVFFHKTRKICQKHFTRANFRNPKMLSQGLFKGVVPSRNLPDIKPVIKIVKSDGTSSTWTPDVTESLIKPVKTVYHLKRCLRLSKHNQQNSINFCSTTLNKAKNRSVIPFKVQPRKRGRPNKK